MPTLLVCLPDDQLPDLDRVRALAPEFEVVRTRSKEDVRPHLGEVTVALGYFPPALVAEAPALEWIQSWSAGLDWLVAHEAFDSSAHPDLMVTSASGVHAVPIGEHVFAVLLALSRQIPRALRDPNAGGSIGVTPEVKAETLDALYADYGGQGSRWKRLWL